MFLLLIYKHFLPFFNRGNQNTGTENITYGITEKQELSLVIREEGKIHSLQFLTSILIPKILPVPVSPTIGKDMKKCR
jgi:hypothetical protein